MAIDNPFEEPTFENSRGFRRKIADLRKKICEFEIAYDEATESGSAGDFALAKDLRDILIAESNEMKRKMPEPSNSYSKRYEEVLARSTRATERLSAFPSFSQSGDGAELRCPLPPLQASTPQRARAEGGRDNLI